MTVSAAQEADEMVAAVRDDPARRLALAADLYTRRPGRAGIAAYGRAQVAFMHWQLRRGVLNGPGDARPGSPWWRAVNEGLLRDGWEAELLVRGCPGPPSRPSVARWVDFLRGPSGPRWYRAHNASVAAGDALHRDLARDELPVERFFMDVALVRVLYTHTLVAAPRLALGPLGFVGRLLGDPRWRGADTFLSLRNILPNYYPLDGISVDEILALENVLGLLVDYGIILPRVGAVYAFAATDLAQPELLSWTRDGALVYAWPYQDRHVWRTDRAPLARHALRALTRPGRAEHG
jgi:hypothetical protein